MHKKIKRGVEKEDLYMLNIKKYLENVDVKEIRLGQSGADVYEINGKSILKHIKREKIENGMF